MDTTKTEPSEPVAGPVERPVRPELWAPDWAVEHAMYGERVQTVLYGAPRDMTGLTRLYDGHDVDVAVAAERERHTKQLRSWADKCDDLADHADPHTCASLRDLAAELRA